MKRTSFLRKTTLVVIGASFSLMGCEVGNQGTQDDNIEINGDLRSTAPSAQVMYSSGELCSAKGVATDAVGSLFIGCHVVNAGLSLKKLSASGQPLWTTSIGETVYSPRLATDAAGNTIVAGHSEETGGNVVAKVGPNGELLWKYRTNEGSSEVHYLTALEIGDDDSALIAGVRNGATQDVGFFQKIDANGARIWSLNSAQAAESIAEKNGRVYCQSGRFGHTAEFQIVDAVSGATVGYRNFGTKIETLAFGPLKLGRNGKFYMLDDTNSTSGVLVQLDDQLTVMSAVNVGVSSFARLNGDYEVDESGTLFATGVLYSRSWADTDTLVVKIDPTGAPIWQATSGRNRSTERGVQLAMTPSQVLAISEWGGLVQTEVLALAK